MRNILALFCDGTLERKGIAREYVLDDGLCESFGGGHCDVIVLFGAERRIVLRYWVEVKLVLKRAPVLVRGNG